MIDGIEKDRLLISIAEGELILRTGQFNGKKRSPEYLEMVRRSVENAKRKLEE